MTTAAALQQPPSDGEARAAAIAAMSWDELTASIAQCTACKLCHAQQHRAGRRRPVPAWMVVGEAPGEQEDKRGEPFVGKAGNLMPCSPPSTRSGGNGVYIANVIKVPPARQPQS